MCVWAPLVNPGDGCKVLARKFALLPALKELLLPYNHMGETGGDSLIKGLKEMAALKVSTSARTCTGFFHRQTAYA